MTSITVDHVSKRFDCLEGGEPVTAVRDVAFKLPSGGVLAVIGPSGCGKSTLLRLIAGILTPDSGRILYDDRELKDIPLRERGIGMVFQEGALVPHWEAERSVSFFLRLRQRGQEVPEKLRQVSRITGIGLEQLLARRPRQLSGGEQQRVGIARALARDLQVLLFDEPFANLDAKYRSEARVELNRLMQAFPVTAVYVTHDQHEAAALAHRIAVMREGHIEQIGPYDLLYHSPQTLFVAGFVGMHSINLFAGKARGGHWEGSLLAGIPLRQDLPDGAPVTLGIRPEFVHLTEDSEAPAGVVDNVIPYLAERYQLLTLTRANMTWTLRAPLEKPIRRGETLRCAFDAENMLFFDAQTGQRIG